MNIIPEQDAFRIQTLPHNLMSLFHKSELPSFINALGRQMNTRCLVYSEVDQFMVTYLKQAVPFSRRNRLQLFVMRWRIDKSCPCTYILAQHPKGLSLQSTERAWQMTRHDTCFVLKSMYPL